MSVWKKSGVGPLSDRSVTVHGKRHHFCWSQNYNIYFFAFMLPPEALHWLKWAEEHSGALCGGSGRDRSQLTTPSAQNVRDGLFTHLHEWSAVLKSRTCGAQSQVARRTSKHIVFIIFIRSTRARSPTANHRDKCPTYPWGWWYFYVTSLRFMMNTFYFYATTFWSRNFLLNDIFELQ